jgi:formate--tetrahydrofolate ligase
MWTSPKLRRSLARQGVRFAVATHVVDGRSRRRELARVVPKPPTKTTSFRFTYALDQPLEVKLAAVATEVYGADGIEIAPESGRRPAFLYPAGFGDLPVIIAKTHLSISHDPRLKGAPTGWTLPIREVRLAAGAGYVYALAGDMRTMPGLGASPAAERIDLDAEDTIVGCSRLRISENRGGIHAHRGSVTEPSFGTIRTRGRSPGSTR